MNKSAEKALQDSQNSYRAMVECAPEAIIVHRLGKILYVNPAAVKLFAASDARDLVGKLISDLIHPDFREGQTARMHGIVNNVAIKPMVEAKFLKLDGTVIDVEVQGTPIAYDGEMAIHVSVRDITLAKEQQRQLEHIAHFDILTGLPNRALLADRLHQAMVQAQRRASMLAVAYLDLDGFKAINDLHGHEVGDKLLVALAERMNQALREGDTLARLGGDEFIAVLPDLADVAACEPMLARLLAAAAQPVQIDDLTLRVTASLGVTFHPQRDAAADTDAEADVDADQLLRQADQAMYQAKLSGKNRFHIFDAEQDSSIRGHHENLERIRRALAEHEFVLYYQPKVNMRTGKVIGAEALVRWRQSEGLLPPAKFLHLIENHPLGIALGEWVIDTALAQMELWQACGLDIPVSVNVGTRHLTQPDFVQRLQILLAQHPNVRPGELELEVLESSALDSIEPISHVIEACREMGVSFSLDDFGTGYSSLTYLKRLPVALLKIDQSFVRGMLEDPDDLAILEGVIGLASAFGREVIAEGVESVAHGTMLLQLGCEMAQGYGIAGPMQAHELPAWAAAWQPAAAWLDLPSTSRDDFPLLVSCVRHRAWMAAFVASLKGECEMPALIELHEGSLRKWMNRVGVSRHGSAPAYAFIESLHQTLHALASELSVLHAWGCTDEAQERLAELQGISDALQEQLQVLVKAESRA